MQASCIINQFNHFADLNPEEEDLLRTLERDPKGYVAGETISECNIEQTCFFTIKSGWAYAMRTLADGERQVLDIFLPGQVMGLREIGFNRSLSKMVALNAVEACPFPKRRLTEIFDRSPRLSDLFFLLMAREQSMLIERIINIGRRPADQRLAHFVLEMKVRLNQSENEFELPLKQDIIGDALGLSSVHVSRTLGKLREMNLVCMENSHVRIRDLDELVEFADFNPAYLESDINWARQG